MMMKIVHETSQQKQLKKTAVFWDVTGIYRLLEEYTATIFRI
jgi:hypothetical protein